MAVSQLSTTRVVVHARAARRTRAASSADRGRRRRCRIVGAERTPGSPKGQTQRRRVVDVGVGSARQPLRAAGKGRRQPPAGSRTHPRHRHRPRHRARALARRPCPLERRDPGQRGERCRSPRPPAPRHRGDIAAREGQRDDPQRAIRDYEVVSSTTAATAFNQRVVSYERERRGPVRAVVARLVGDGEIPALDTTSPPVSGTGVAA